MSEAKENEHSANKTTKEKKPYVKPSFRREKVFETTALSCGKVGVTQRQCSSYRRSS